MISRLVVGFFGLVMISHSAVVFAQQNRDILYLIDGSKQQGKLIEYKDKSHIYFQMFTGDTLFIRGEQMMKVKGLRLGKKGYNQSFEGWWHITELGLTFNNEGFGVYGDFTTQHTSGYQWNKWMKLGLGVGYNGYDDILVLPVFLSIQADWFANKITPYHFVNIGHATAWERTYGSDFEEFTSVQGGLHFNPGVGVKIHGPNTHFVVSVGYQVQHARLESEPFSWSGEPGLRIEDRQYRMLSVRLGIGF